MKSLAFIVVGLTVGIIVMFVLMNSGLLVNPNKNTNTFNEKPLVQNIPSPVPSPSSNTIKIEHKNPYFVSYEVTIPNSWTSRKEEGYSNYIVISNGLYEITIKQTESEGSLCTYPGDPETTNITVKKEYKFYKQLTTKDGTSLRRSGDSEKGIDLEDGSLFMVCGKVPENKYQIPLAYGYTNIKTPKNPSELMLQEIDQILSTLKKI